MIRAAAALAIAVLLAGCNPSVDSFSIHRFSAEADKEFEPLDRTVTNTGVASRLYEDVRALRPQPEGTYFCGLDFGIRYELSFFAGRDRILRLMLLALVVPGQIGMLPLFLIVRQLSRQHRAAGNLERCNLATCGTRRSRRRIAALRRGASPQLPFVVTSYEPGRSR